MFQIEIDQIRKRVIIDFVGTYDNDLTEFSQQMKMACMKARGGSGHFDMLSDFTQAPLMTQQTAHDSEAHVQWCKDHGLRKAANVVGSALSKLQLNRITADDKFRIFETRAEAEAWLDT